MPDLQDAYRRQAAGIRTRIEQVIRRSWAGLPSYRDRDMDAWVAATLPLVLAAQRQMATLTDAYLARLAGQAVRGLDLAKVTGAALRGVPPAAVYRRPAVTVYTALSKGRSVEFAGRMGLTRALSIVATDVQLAKTHTARISQQARGVRYFTRVLSGGKNCALCVIASTQRYHVGDLAPIHPGCNCDVADAVADADPGQVIDPDLLDEAHRAVAEATGRSVDFSGRDVDYRKLVVVHDHGEIGPVLALAGQHFDGPSVAA